MAFLSTLRRACVAGLAGAGTLAAASLVAAGPASATPALVVDASTGAVLFAEEATRPWYPASLTKLMTVYVALKAVHERRLSLQTPLTVTARAARMPPSKMGFKPRTEVTLENALKILMVHSANDVAITIAEGVSGSVEAFAAEMNAAARAIGMRESHFVNPNGLHNVAHYSSARDMAVLARALLRQFPEHQELYGIGAFKLGNRIYQNHNGVLGRYPGADGMKTGFVCASGFNVVATATRGGRKLIVVLMGESNARVRTLHAMQLFDASFHASGSGALESLPSSGYASAPDMRPDICSPKRGPAIANDFPIPVAGVRAAAAPAQDDSPAAFFAADRNRAVSPVPFMGSGAPVGDAAAGVQLAPRAPFTPIPVYVGRAPGWTGGAAGPRGAQPVADDDDKPKRQPPRRGLASARPDVGAPMTLGAQPAAKPGSSKAKGQPKGARKVVADKKPAARQGAHKPAPKKGKARAQ